MWTPEEVEDYNTEQAQAKLPPAEREALRDELKKRRGRPPGSKDSRPRRRRIKWGEDGSELTPTEGVMYVTIDGTVQVVSFLVSLLFESTATWGSISNVHIHEPSQSTSNRLPSV